MEGELMESKRIAETAEAMASKRRKVVCSRKCLQSPPSSSPLRRLNSPTKLDCVANSAAGDFSSFNVCYDERCRLLNNATVDEGVQESLRLVDLDENPSSKTVRPNSIKENNEIREPEPSDEPSADAEKPNAADVPTAAAKGRNEALAPAPAPAPPRAWILPPIEEIEEFLSNAESYEQKHFTEKYNFDFVNDVPLEGRYEWFPLKP